MARVQFRLHNRLFQHNQPKAVIRCGSENRCQMNAYVVAAICGCALAAADAMPGMGLSETIAGVLGGSVGV